MYGFWPPTTAIKFSPSYSLDRTIYGVSETKLFRSTDGGDTWVNVVIPTSQHTSLNSAYDLLLFPLNCLSHLWIFNGCYSGFIQLFSFRTLAIRKKLPFKRMQIKAGSIHSIYCRTLIVLSIVSSTSFS